MPTLLTAATTDTPKTQFTVPLAMGMLAAITRRSPAFSAAQAISRNTRIAQLLSEGAGKAWAPVPGGSVLAPLQNEAGRRAYFCGDEDPTFTSISRHIVRPGHTVVDVGAGIGVASLWLASLVKSQGKVHAFEADITICASLLRTARHNDTPQLRIINAIVGSGARTAHTTIADVPMLRLDEHHELPQQTPLRLLRIASAASLTGVLRGCAALLETHAPSAIWARIDSDAPTLGQHTAIQLLRSYDYECFSTVSRLTGPRLNRLDYAKPLPKGVRYILALHRCELREELGSRFL
jgi:hypothetical protein